MKRALLILALLAATASAQQQDRYDRDRNDDRRGEPADRGDDIQLVCFGLAEKMTMENRSGYEWNPEKHKYETTSSVTTGKRDFDTSVNISIHDDQGRIRLPKQLIPPMHSGGHDGWWDIDDLIVGHNEIRGRFALNGLNRPTVSIDRRSGAIVVDGMVKFNGRCDADSGHRRF